MFHITMLDAIFLFAFQELQPPMYQDRRDKKRQRVTPPPNQVWMEAILSKGKISDDAMPRAVTSSSPTTSRPLQWPKRERCITEEGPMVYEGTGVPLSSHLQVVTRSVERSTLYEGRRMMTVAGAAEITATSEAMGQYQGRTTMDGFHSYQTRTGQSRTMDRALTYQKQAREGEGAAVFQAREYQQGRLIQGQPGSAREGSTGKAFRGRNVNESSGKMAQDYKRDRKLPPRVEEMLREQVNLDKAVLHDAFAVAMEDLIVEREANFVAKGLCHLCGVHEKQYMPVVNFCPRADEHHSLCREHLRSVYRVRMEALFVGRNGATPNRRLLRCLVCAHGCPCTLCRAEKERKVHQYKCYLLDTLRRSGQGSVSVMRDGRTVAVASSVPEGRLTYDAIQCSNEGHRYVQYPPTPPVEDGPSARHEEFRARSLESEAAHDERRLVQSHQPELKQYPQNIRNGYGSNLQTSSVRTSSMQALSMQVSNLQSSRMETSGIQALSMQAQQKHSSQYPPVPRRAAKSIPADFLSVMADSAPVADPRAPARVASPRVRQGFTKLPSATTILNCSESEKSLVQLLSSLNQGGAPAGSVVSSQISKESRYSQSESRYATNDIAAKNEPSGIVQGFNNIVMEATPLVYPAPGIANRHRQAVSPYHTSSMDSADDNTPRERSIFDAQSFEGSLVLKPTANESEVEVSLEPRDLHNTASRDDFWALHRSESAASEQRNGGQRQHQTKTRSDSKPDSRGKKSTFKSDINGNQSSPPHRGPGRPRKISDGAAATALSASRAGRKGPQERKKNAPLKKGRGRPLKRAKRATNDDKEITLETNEGENKEDDKEKGGSDSELDANLDYCEVCQGAGDLVCCDKCPRSFHLKCLHMTEVDLPEGDWQCNECNKPSRFDAYAVAVASEKNMVDKCLKIVQCLKSHPFSKQFLSPVANVPMYTRVVKQPMDLSKIENKLQKGAYVVDTNTVADGVVELDSTQFANDIRLMWSNCKLFNSDGSGIARAADILSAGFERLYEESIAPVLSA